MDRVFLNAINQLHLDLSEAVAATSTRAAKQVGLPDRGEIAVGKRADLLSYSAQDNTVTLINS
jgi:alpha-D-ribose 1-methylphosphonate 5-triphosphate diphosphatase PhnM